MQTFKCFYKKPGQGHQSKCDVFVFRNRDGRPLIILHDLNNQSPITVGIERIAQLVAFELKYPNPENIFWFDYRPEERGVSEESCFLTDFEWRRDADGKLFAMAPKIITQGRDFLEKMLGHSLPKVAPFMQAKTEDLQMMIEALLEKFCAANNAVVGLEIMIRRVEGIELTTWVDIGLGLETGWMESSRSLQDAIEMLTEKVKEG